MTKIPFPKKNTSCATQMLDLVHTDLCDPMQIASHGGSKYVLPMTDDYSRYTTVYYLKNKSETFSKFKDCVNLMERHSGKKLQKLSIKTLRSDNGGEYLNLIPYVMIVEFIENSLILIVRSRMESQKGLIER